MRVRSYVLRHQISEIGFVHLIYWLLPTSHSLKWDKESDNGNPSVSTVRYKLVETDGGFEFKNKEHKNESKVIQKSKNTK